MMAELTTEQATKTPNDAHNEQHSSLDNHSPGMAHDSPGSHSTDSLGNPPTNDGTIKAETLYTLAVLSGDVAKWMISDMGDWVELSAVRAAIYCPGRLLWLSSTFPHLCFPHCRWTPWNTTW